MNDNLGNTQGQLYLLGSRGYSAYEVAVLNGFVGTEEEWLDSLKGEPGEPGTPFGELTPEEKEEIRGPEGKSAYEVSVENGFIGTEQEWVNSFLTPDGYYNKDEVDTAFVKKENVVNNLTSVSTVNPLAANQGQVLKGMIDSNTSLINNEVSNRENAESDLQTQITALASGSPLVATDTSEMTDTTRVYVNTTDGEWYYYDGNDWVSGGTYQAAEDSETVDYIEQALYLNKILEAQTIEVDPAMSNYFIGDDGDFAYSANYNLSQVIHLTAGESVEATFFAGTNTGAIIEYPGGFSASYEPYNVLVVGTSTSETGEQLFTYKAEENIDIFLCYNKNEHTISDITVNRINKIEAKPNIKIIKDSSTQFSVYSYHQNEKKYLRHTFIHKTTINAKTTSGETMETQNVWYAQSIYDGANLIAQGNTNFIHNIRDNDTNIGYSGAGDGSCKAIWTKFFADGELYDFENETIGHEVDCDNFRFMTKVEHYLCTGGGTEDSSSYRTVVDSNGNFIVESINDIDFKLSANSKIEMRNRLHVKRNNTQYYECHGAMSCGYYPYFDNVIVNDDNMDWNSFVLNNGTWETTTEGDTTVSMPYTSLKGDTVVIFGNKYRMTTSITQVNGNRYDKTNTYMKRYTDGRIKTYMMPVIAHISSGETEKFNDGDTIDIKIERNIDIKA